MAKFYRNFSIFISLIIATSYGFSQSNEIEIKFIGNCGLFLTDKNAHLYIDFPYKSGAFNYMKYDPSEIDSIKDNSFFLFTHRHPDHYSKKILRKIKSKHKGNVYGNWNPENIQKLNSLIADFKIEVFKSKHRFSFSHYSYLITWHGKRIFLSGDTETAEIIASVKNINWAFVPTWIILDSKEKNLKIDTEKFGVYHLYPNESINNLIPEKVKLLDKQGEVIKIKY